VRTAILATLLLGCEGELVGSSSSTFLLGTEGAAVALAPLGGDVPDVLVAIPQTGQIEVLAEQGGWRSMGQAFAGGEPLELAAGQVGGRAVVLVRLEQMQVTCLLADETRAHWLTFPIRVWQSGRLNGIAVADLDGDGDDELLAAHGEGLQVVRELARLAEADPESPPNLADAALDVEPLAAVTAADIDDDGAVDVVGLTAAGRLRRVDPTGGVAPAEVPAPEGAARLVPSACPEAPLVVLGERPAVGLSPTLEAVPARVGAACVPLGSTPLRALAVDAGGAREARLAADGASVVVRGVSD
jgi:hypothetical protein